LKNLLAMTCVAATLAGGVVAQDRVDRGHPGGMSRGVGRGEFPAGGRGGFEPARPGGYGRGGPMPGPPAYGRGGPVYAQPRSGSPAYGHGGPAYPPQRYGPPPGYGPYPQQPYGGSPAFGGQWRDQQEFLRQGVRQGQLAPLGRVISAIRQHTPGRQLDAGLEYQGSRLVYRVRWMTENGRRVDYIVDAATGAIVSGR
jgi:hypothetical protein